MRHRTRADDSGSDERRAILAGLPAVGARDARLAGALADGAPRFIFYSHDGLGLGHVRRNLAIAAQLVKLAPEALILLATGVDGARRLGDLPNVEILKLPGLRKVANEHYVARHLRVPEDDILKIRSTLLAAAVTSFRPNVLLVDRHPLGVGGELRSSLDSLRRLGGRAVLGLRDILDAPRTIVDEFERHDLHREIVDQYDRILVFGDPQVFDSIREYRFPAAVAQLTRFCGYVVNPPGGPKVRVNGSRRGATPRPLVLATIGGGEDGLPIIEAFIRASFSAPWRAMAVTGPLAPNKEVASLRGLASAAGVRFEVFVEDLADWFGAIDALVSQGGYNTLTEAVAKGVPLVCVPRSQPRVEQLLRARAFGSRGLLRVIEPDSLSPERLRSEVTSALGASRKRLLQRAHAVLDFAGAERAAGHLLEVAQMPAMGRVRDASEIGARVVKAAA